MIPKLLARIDKLSEGLSDLRKEHEDAEAKNKHIYLHLEAIEAELSTSIAQVASVHERYSDRDEQILRTIAECMEGSHIMQSEAGQDAVRPSLHDLLQLRLPSLLSVINAFTPLNNPHTPFFSLHHFGCHYTSDPSFHSAEQPIPIPPPGSNIGSSAIACIGVAPPASYSSGVTAPSYQVEDEAQGGVGEQ